MNERLRELEAARLAAAAKKPRTNFRIKIIHAFIALDPRDASGDEGVMGANIGGVVYTLVSADERRLSMYRELAEREIARNPAMKDVKITLVRFTQREDLEVLSPGRNDE